MSFFYVFFSCWYVWFFLCFVYLNFKCFCFFCLLDFVVGYICNKIVKEYLDICENCFSIFLKFFCIFGLFVCKCFGNNMFVGLEEVKEWFWCFFMFLILLDWIKNWFWMLELYCLMSFVLFFCFVFLLVFVGFVFFGVGVF